jgi:hypothetical protein
VSDDPEPTDYKHFEIYSFSNGIAANNGKSGEAGIDFNYGGAPDLQLTATVPDRFSKSGLRLSIRPTGLGLVRTGAGFAGSATCRSMKVSSLPRLLWARRTAAPRLDTVSHRTERLVSNISPEPIERLRLWRPFERKVERE